MYFWYKLLTYLFYPFAPIYLYFRKLRKKEDLIRYKEKLSKINISRDNGFLIWFHVASVGEAMSILPLIDRCAKEEKISVLEEENVETQMIESFREGYDELINGDVLYAAKKFNEAELLYPQSHWAPKAALMAAYAYYSDNYYGDAIFEIKRYLKTYPNHKNIDYAHWLTEVY